MSHEANLRVEHELFVRSFFRVAPPDRVVQQMAARMTDHLFDPGETIFERGVTGDRIFFVVHGEIVTEAPGQEPWYFEGGALIGIVDAVLDRPHLRSARAQRASHVVSLAFEDYQDILDDNFDFAKTALEAAAEQMMGQAIRLAPDRVIGPEDRGAGSPLELSGREPGPAERIQCLREVTFMKRAPVQPLVNLTCAGDVRSVPAAEVLWREGDRNDHLTFLMQGRVRVERGTPGVDVTFGPNSLIEGLAALAFDRHFYTATAASNVLVLRVSKEEAFDVMEDHVELTRSCFAWIATENERTRRDLAARFGTSSVDRIDRRAS